jgi:GAF domain-containing protein
MIHRHRIDHAGRGTSTYSRFFDDVDARWPLDSDLTEVFSALTRELQNLYEFDRAVLLIRENGNTRFTAVSTWDNGRLRRNLTVVIPGESSLFEKIAETGRIYSEEYCGLFSGNPFERDLLFTDGTQSYALQPLKYDGEVVGLIGFSSTEPSAFATFEEGALSRIADQLARRIAHKTGVVDR